MSDHKPDIHEELYEVSGDGDCARVKELLEAGADPNKFKSPHGYTALHAAAENGHNEVAKTLTQSKCDVNVKNKFRYTALHRASGNGHNEVVETLIQAKCDLNVKSQDGDTALHRAAENGHGNVVISLLESGAEPNFQNAEKTIPRKKYLEWKFDEKLDWVSHAISQGNHELVLNFLEKVPSSKKKGKEDYNNYFLCYFLFQLIS